MTGARVKRFGSELPAWATTILLALVAALCKYGLIQITDGQRHAQESIDKMRDSLARIETRTDEADRKFGEQGLQIASHEEKIEHLDERVSHLEASR